MLPLIFTLAVDTSPVAPPDGTYTYASTYNGQALGKTTIDVKRDQSGNVVLSESAAGSYNGRGGSTQDTLTLASTLAPSAYAATSSVAGSTLHSNLSFNGTTASLTGDAGARSFTLGTDAKHFIVLDIGPFTGYFMLPAQMTAWGDPPVLALIPSYGQSFALAFDGTFKPDRPKSVPATDTSIASSKPLPFAVWYDPKTLVVDEVDVPSENLQVVRQPGAPAASPSP